MITPAFNLTATERVLPKLALDFTTAVLDSRVTVTRTTNATNPATFINSAGLVTLATNNQPRFDYDPVTLACKGLLIEESRTNIINQSDNFSAASWTANTSTVTSNAATSPDGTVNADRWLSDPGSTSHYLGQFYTSSASLSYTLSVWVKSATGSNQTFRLFVQSGVFTSNLTATSSWQRFTLTLPLSAAGSFVAGLTRNSSDGPVDLFVYGAQLEAGAFATSYIPTVAASLTRNADVVQMTGTNFSDWYNASQGTFAAEFIRPTVAAGGFPSIIAARQAAANDSQNTIEMYADTSTISTLVRTAGVAGQFSQYFGAAIGSVVNVVLAYKVNNFAVAYNGNAATDTLSGNLPTVDMLNIGYNTSLTSQVLNSHIQSIRFWPQRLTSAEVQAFSK